MLHDTRKSVAIRAGGKATSRRPKKRAPAKRAKTTGRPSTASPLVRRDGTGHLDAGYAADLHARSQGGHVDMAVDRAFLRTSTFYPDALAEGLGEQAVLTMTSAEDQSAELQYVPCIEEVGGPFEATTGREEFAAGTDGSNPREATREPFPRT